MDRVHAILAGAARLAAQVPPLFLVAVAAVLVALLGSALSRRLPWSGGFLRLVGNLALVAVLAVTALRFIHLDPAFDGVLPSLGFKSQEVVGDETRVPLSPDGHYWLEGSVNGTAQRFMVDTGATLTVLSEQAAADAGVGPDPLRLPVTVRTAGGSVRARLARIEELHAGSVEAHGLDAIVTGGTGGLNVLGMNFLGRLKSWRVEDGVLVLTPIPVAAASGTP
ncbi:TIGR02281 family clan AA aspartic protease [Novosphingobium sp. ZN18A2]|uniref:retropepsin-like aspartic protease family protein n=1 Tax=Novosphingobium sp. ZN18A2 TaxID=3079861 RepID=UPI0030CE2D55